MALGKGHFSFNLIFGILIFSSLFFYLTPVISISFIIGFMFSTLLFSPDLDLGPKKSFGLAGLFLYPYSIFFKHRGLSHSFIFGTLSRIIYAIIILIITIIILNKLNFKIIDQNDFFMSFLYFIKHYNYTLIEYKISTWIFIGMFVADAFHIFLDKLSSVWNVLKR